MSVKQDTKYSCYFFPSRIRLHTTNVSLQKLETQCLKLSLLAILSTSFSLAFDTKSLSPANAHTSNRVCQLQESPSAGWQDSTLGLFVAISFCIICMNHCIICTSLQTSACHVKALELGLCCTKSKVFELFWYKYVFPTGLRPSN